MRRKKQLPCNVDLPVELVTEVLARLPIKSLLRFRCVCKSWHSLISTPDFASLHLARYHNDDDENTPVLTSTSRGGTNRWMLRSTHNFKKITSRYCRNLDKTDFKCPEGYYPRGISVNGVLILSKCCMADIILWNPILGKTHKLPPLCIDVTSLGLGFSPSNNDYKVVAISKANLPSVYIYTLSSCTWRSIVDYEQSIVHDVYAHSHGVLIKDSLFWLTMDYYREGSQMVSFDVSNEVFDYIKLPPILIGLDVYRRHPVGYRKWVGLLDVYMLSCCLWVMEKEQGPGGWTKLYIIDFQPRSVPGIICFKKNGHFMLASTMLGMELCNIETQHMEDLMKSYTFCYPYSSHRTFYCTLYKESLVLL